MDWFGLKQLIKLYIPRFCNDRAVEWWLREFRKGVVISGPFSGTSYISESFGSSFFPKVLGTYEKELADFWRPDRVQSFDSIINIGCAEGYYLAGLGRLSRRESGEHAELFGYDLSEKAIGLCRELLEKNGLEVAKLVAGPFDGAGLDANKVLVICDIEGAEEAVMDPDVWTELLYSTLVIEVHDQAGETRVLDLLKNRFSGSHSIDHISFSERNKDDFPQIKWPWFSSAAKKKMVDECRLNGKDWLVMHPNTSRAS
jgi:hypothetical protein